MDPLVVLSSSVDNPATAKLYYGQDCRKSLQQLPEKSVHTIATSPPYWGLRDYGNDPGIWDATVECDHEWGDLLPSHHPGQVEQSINSNAVGAGAGGRATSGQYCQKCNAWYGQLGLEPTPELFVTHLVEVFREARRVLRDDGTLWVNLGDSYSRGDRGYVNEQGGLCASANGQDKYEFESPAAKMGNHPFIKPKDLVGIPWMVALALRNDGWYLRSDIVWAKANCMPESVLDRPTRNHEYIFLLSKKERYFYDIDAVREPHKGDSVARSKRGRSDDHKYVDGPGGQSINSDEGLEQACHPGGKNKRTVWNVNPKPYAGAHFAVWPEKLVEPMILAGSGAKGCCSKCGAALKRVVDKETYREKSETREMDKTPLNVVRAGWRDGGPKTNTVGWEKVCNCTDAEIVRCVVLDPFSGSATTGAVALKHGRDYIGLDKNDAYVGLAEARLLGNVPPAVHPEAEGDSPSIADMFGSDDD